MILVHSKIRKALRINLKRLASWYGRQQLIPVYVEDNILYFYQSKEVRSSETNVVHNSQQAGKRIWLISALESPTNTLHKDLTPIGDDTEPIEVLRHSVEMKNDGDEEPLEASFRRARLNAQNPSSRGR